jgi:cytochrome c2
MAKTPATLIGASVIGFALVASMRAGLVAAPDQQSPPRDPERAAVMQHHFVQVARVQEAIIRGDLRGALPPAAELAAMQTPPGMPAAADGVVSTLRQSARVAGTAPNLRQAATATVRMLQQCAACHRTANVYPAPIARKRPDLSGVVGHMLQHLEAVDRLLEGLVIPSESLWMEGAERLKTATLRPSEWPRDRKLTPEILKAEATVHALADSARTATTSEARGAVYAHLLTTCANCHSLHRTAWGPRTR